MQLSTIAEVAGQLGASEARVQQYLRDGELVSVRGADGVPGIPAEFVQDGRIVKSLRGVITLLRDARFDDAEIVEWLFRPDDSLVPTGAAGVDPATPSTPIAELRANRGGEVKRRAQAAGF